MRDDEKNLPEKREPPIDGVSRDLLAFEAALSHLQPRVDDWDQNRLMFLAGQMSVAGGRLPGAQSMGRVTWPLSFGAMTTVAVVLFAILMTRPTLVVERAVPPNAQVVKQDPQQMRPSDDLGSNFADREEPVASIGTPDRIQMAGLSRLSALEARRWERSWVERSYPASDLGSNEPLETATQRPVLTTRSWEEFLPDLTDRS
jgi:hypothetical protein